MRSGKLEIETLARILLITGFLIVILLLFKGGVDGYQQLGSMGIKQYGCWATNLMKANVITLWPSTCRTQVISQETDIKTTGNLMAGCWWQYGQGKWDLGARTELNNWEDYAKYTATYANILDSVSTCYALQPKEEISVNKLRVYMETHNAKGEETKEAKNSLWNYLQKASQGDNTCFDKNDKGILKKGEIYYIRFLDDRAAYGPGKRDIIGISSNDKFFEEGFSEKSFWVSLWHGKSSLCYDYGKENIEDRKDSNEFFTNFINKIKSCKESAVGGQCSCSDQPYTLSGLPENAAIKIKQDKDGISFRLYYNDKPEGKEEKIEGKAYEAGAGSSDQLEFKEIKNELVLTERVYAFLTKDKDIAFSKTYINTRKYPLCKELQGENKEAENLFENFIKSINECKKSASGEQCSCSDEPYIHILPKNYEIKANQESGYVSFKIYYKNQQVGNEAKIEGSILERTETSSTRQPKFEKIKGEMVISKTGYYAALTKEGDIALSTAPIDPTSYPDCASEAEKKEQEKKQAEEIFNKLTTLIKSCKPLSEGTACRCSEDNLEFINSLAEKSNIKLEQAQNTVRLQLYYNNYPLGEYETTPGSLFVMGPWQESLTWQIGTSTKKLDPIPQITFSSKSSYHMLFTKNTGEFAFSKLSLIPKAYPSCAGQQGEQ